MQCLMVPPLRPPRGRRVIFEAPRAGTSWLGHYATGVAAARRVVRFVRTVAGGETWNRLGTGKGAPVGFARARQVCVVAEERLRGAAHWTIPGFSDLKPDQVVKRARCCFHDKCENG